MPPGMRQLTRELYDLMLAGFREEPGNASHAARKAGCDPRTCQRAWAIGWPKHKWATPIREVIANEAVQARAAAVRERAIVARQAEADRSLARQESVDQRKQLQALAKGMRGTLGWGVKSLNSVGNVLSQVLSHFPEDMEKLRHLAPDKKIRLAHEYGRAVDALVTSLEKLDKIARLDEGVPTEILGVQAGDMTMEQAAAEIDHAKHLLDMARESGLIGPPSGSMIMEAEIVPAEQNGSGKSH